MADQSVNIIVTAKDHASRHFKTIGMSFGSMVSAGLRIGAAVGGIYGLQRAIVGSVKEFMAAEAAAKGLSDALGGASVEQYQTFAKEMQRITTFEDDATIATMKLGVTIAKLTGDDLKAATQAAMGLSKAYNMDLEAAMRLVSKAAMGETGTFKRLGIVLKDGLSDQQKYQEVLRIGTDQFRLATGETDTFGGMIKQLGNAWGDAKESLGQYISESARLKGVFAVVTFGLRNIGSVAKTAWDTARAALDAYYDRQIERADKPGNSWFKKIVTYLGTAMADMYLEHGAPGMGLAGKRGILGGGTPITTEGRNRFGAGIKGVFGDVNKSYLDAMGRPVPGSGKSAASGERAENSWADLIKKWITEKVLGSGRFDFGSGGFKGGGGSAAKAIFGEQSRSGFGLFESRTAGGINRGESPESRKLDKMIDYLAQIANQNKRFEEKGRYVAERTFPAIAVTNFR